MLNSIARKAEVYLNERSGSEPSISDIVWRLYMNSPRLFKVVSKPSYDKMARWFESWEDAPPRTISAIKKAMGLWWGREMAPMFFSWLKKAQVNDDFMKPSNSAIRDQAIALLALAREITDNPDKLVELIPHLEFLDTFLQLYVGKLNSRTGNSKNYSPEALKKFEQLWDVVLKAYESEADLRSSLGGVY